VVSVTIFWRTVSFFLLIPSYNR